MHALAARTPTIRLQPLDTYYGVTYIRRGGLVSAFSQPMTHDCKWLKVGGQPVEDSTAQKTAREKLLVTRNGHPPDVGPPPRPVRMGSDHPEGTKDALDHPGWTK